MSKKKTMLMLLPAFALALCAGLFLGSKAPAPAVPVVQLETTDEAAAAYTWEEYLSLSLEEQDAYFQQFESEKAFEAWMASVKPTESTEPVIRWDAPGKTPDTYTWEEYQMLSAGEQEAFFQWFDSVDAFKAWMASVKPTDSTEPVTGWNKPGKTPDAYTWDEYQTLSPTEQEAFYRWFGSLVAFENWMASVKPTEPTEPVAQWNKSGKTPDAYTWDEYLALNYEEQEAFFLWFDSAAAFEAWMNTAKPEETAEPVTRWNKSGKTPDAYTWEEYQALTGEEQEAFYQWFGSVDAFEAWMNSVKPAECTEPDFEWNDSRTPDTYTWEEYQTLSPEEQEAFYLWFGSVEAFEAWMAGAMDEERSTDGA